MDDLSSHRHLFFHFHCVKDIDSKKVCTLKINSFLRDLLSYICFSQLFLQTMLCSPHEKGLFRSAFRTILHQETKCQLYRNTLFFELLMAPYIRECHILFNLFTVNFLVFLKTQNPQF